MKILETAKKTAKKAATAAVDAVLMPVPRQKRDPWYFNDEFVAEVNARRDGSWLGGRRRGWLQRRRTA